MRFRLVCVTFFAYSFGFSQTAADAINANEAYRIITYLASDSLKGRGNFSLGLEKAATFIADEFRENNLLSVNDYWEYYQPFIVSDKKYNSFEEVYLNNRLLPANEYLFLSAVTFPPELQKQDFEVKELISSDFKTIVDSVSLPHSTSPRIYLIPDSLHSLLKELQEHRKKIPLTKNIILFVKKPQAFNELLLRVKPEVRKSTLFNVIGMLPGKEKANELIIISAHYDHVGIGKPVAGDSIYNGANDNASGTAAMLMLANYFAAKNKNDRTILFVAFAGEEIGLIGSKQLSEALNTKSIVAMLNFEMLGKPNNNGLENECIITGSKLKSLPKFFKRIAKQNGITLKEDHYYEERLYERSDHYPFSKKGVPAYMMINFSRNDNTYHQPSDETSTLDLDNMCAILKGILPAIEELVSAEFTPKR